MQQLCKSSAEKRLFLDDTKACHQILLGVTSLPQSQSHPHSIHINHRLIYQSPHPPQVLTCRSFHADSFPCFSVRRFCGCEFLVQCQHGLDQSTILVLAQDALLGRFCKTVLKLIPLLIGDNKLGSVMVFSQIAIIFYQDCPAERQARVIAMIG
jgi:hypothetical protein